MNLPYSFEPLFNFLEKLDLTLDDIVEQKYLSRSTVEKIANNQPVMLSSAAKLCLSLGCDLADIVSINYAYDPTEVDDDGMQSYKPWTEEEEKRLIEAYSSGIDMSTIARNFKRSRGAIANRINRLELTGRLQKRKRDEYLLN